MAVQVNPIVARKGRFMKSFEEKGVMMEEFIARAEAALKGTGVEGQRIVFTKIPQWSDKRHFDTWQVYLIPDSLLSAEDERINPRYKFKAK
jgi:hypothetical protein